MKISDETLMAYADGELSAGEAAAVAAVLAGDPAMAARVERFRGVRRALKSAYDSVVEEPIPDRLTALLQQVDGRQHRSAPIVDLAKVRAAVKGASPPAWAAMAACLIGGVLVGRLSALDAPSLFTAQSGELRAGAALTEVLEQRLSSDTANVDSNIRVGLTFRSEAGSYCRTFESDGDVGAASGLACREGGGWRVAIATGNAGGADGDSYRQASAAAPLVLEAVDAIIAGEPLDEDEEIAARDSGWR